MRFIEADAAITANEYSTRASRGTGKPIGGKEIIYTFGPAK